MNEDLELSGRIGSDIYLNTSYNGEQIRRAYETKPWPGDQEIYGLSPKEENEGDEDEPSGNEPMYLTFTALEPNSTIGFEITEGGYWTKFYMDPLPIEYSVDNGETWEKYSWIDNEHYGETITLQNASDKIMFRGNNSSYGYVMDEDDPSGTEHYPSCHRFKMTGSFSASGDVTSLVNEVGGDCELGNYCFSGLFSMCESLVTPPNLPSTTLSKGCYGMVSDDNMGIGMFGSCTSLTEAPSLPATRLAPRCYYSMFMNCTSLETAPELPATTVIEKCYYNMFNGCTSLTTAPSLPATTLAGSCYSSMFSGCTSLTTASLPATTLAESCYSSMFSECTSLTTASLPATTLAEYCYYSMFGSCTSLTEAPSLPATTLAGSCYSNMFENCTSLTTAPSLPATTLAEGCCSNMFSGCTSLTTAPSLPATNLAGSCYYSMFSGCTSLETAPELLATTPANNCYYNMFNGCTSLSYIKCLITTIYNTNYGYCTSGWVNGVAASGTFVRNANMTYPWITGTDGIPEGWTVETV